MNGSEGSISNKTYQSIRLLDCGLNLLKSNILHYCDFEVNVLSRMTLELEYFHSPVNLKQGFKTILQYVRSFSASVKEGIKTLTQWNVYYFTSKDSWYLLPESSMLYKDLKMPTPLL